MSKRSLFGAIGLIGVGIVFGVVLMTNFSTNAIENLFAMGVNDLGAKQPPATAPASVKEMNNQFVAVADAVTKSVVSISVKTDRKSRSGGGGGGSFEEEFFRRFDPNYRGQQDEEESQTEDTQPDAAGSGVIITADGYVVTNNHVVESARENGIKITTSDKREYKARLVGRDPLTDLAVLKIDGATFPAAHFGERKNIHIGEWVIAVGNPLGLKSTVTAGIVSAMGRGIGIVGSQERNNTSSRFAVENFIQTDAAINPGNSGGGLFNLDGSLVGINTAIASYTGRNEGYGFAIPIDMVRSVALDLIDDGKIQRGYVGVEISSIDETSARAAGLTNVEGVLVNKVVKGGAAEASGIEIGDVILSVDNNPVSTSNELQNQIVLHRAGDKVNLKLWRDGKEISKMVTLRTLDGSDDVAAVGKAGATDASSQNMEPVSFKGYGFTAGPLSDEAQKEYGSNNGVMVTRVDSRGSAARRGLRPNTVILKADGKNVTSPSQLRNIFAGKKAGDGVLLVVKDREGTKQAITVEVPEDNS